MTMKTYLARDLASPAYKEDGDYLRANGYIAVFKADEMEKYIQWLETAAKVVCDLRIQQLTGPQDQQVISWIADPQCSVYKARLKGK